MRVENGPSSGSIGFLRRGVLALVLAALPALAQAASGIDWLATQQNADGSFGSNPASLATPLQGTAEVLYTYQALEETAQAAYAPALEYVNTNNEINTEYLARTIMVNAGAGTDVTSLLQTLLDHQNADGGFGDHPGYDSSVYDTAWALEAMAVIGYPLGDTIGRTVGFLINHQLSSGGWVDGENDSSPYVSALVLQALGHYREAYVGVAATVSRAQDFLFAQRSGDGTWGTPFVTASAMVALLSTISDRALLDASVVALSGAQSADGSWVQDAYTTALALRAIHAHDTHPSGAPAPGGPTPPPPAPDKGSFTGSVKIAGSNAPLAGVTLTISELPSVSTATGSDGTFSITQLAPGPYTLIARKDGYLSATVVSGITAGQVTQIGNLVLQQVSQTGIVRGVVLEAGFDLGLANAVVTLKGASETFGASDDGGRFDLGAVVPGDYTLTVTKTNFNTVTTTLSVLAGKIYETKFSLTREGVYDDRPGNVFGRVVNGENGNPIVGALIDLGNGQTAAADTEGNFLITDVPRATYTGSVSNGGFQTVPFTLVLSPVCSGNLGTITLYPEVPEAVPPSTLTLVGTLVDAQTQDPIAGATVSTGSTSATTDTNGAFTLADLTTTSNLVTASATGYQTGQYQINASGFGSAKVTLALNEDTGVPPPDPNAIYGATGIVLDAGTNQPLAGVTVGGLFGGQQHTTITGADGRFTLTGLVSNEGDIQFLLDGYLSKAIRVNLAPLTITRIGQVLLREDSAPLPDIVVSSINTQEAPTDPHTLQISGSVAVTITNQGTASTSANVSLLAFYDVDRNERYDDGIDLLLGKGTSANALDAGAAEEVLVQIEGTVPYRDVVIRLWADSTEVIEESDEANNMSSSVSACEVIPPTPTFDTVVKWHSSLRLTVSHTPVVGPLRDTNGDGAVDKNDAPVIVYHQGGWFSGSYGLIAVDGRSGAMLWNYTGAGFSLAIAPAIGDVDGDGKPEVLAIVQSGGIIVVAINGNGTEKWRSAVAMDISSLAVTIADLEGDGQAEILAGNIVLNSDGSLKWRASTSDIDRNLIIPIAVDLDLDGTKEVIIGPRAYRADGSVYWDISAQYPRAQFRPAVANLDDDPYPEVVSVLLPPGSPTRLIAFNHDGTLAWERVGAGGRGAPTIVDLDGDGSVEILLGGWTAFRVFSDTGAIKWSVTPGDPSSGSTGATAFDFDRDGILEIVYANEENLRIFSWKTKQLLASFPRFSATWYEYPVVADIDNDGRAEILVTTAGDGLYALEEVNDLWPATRGIWNQEAYYIDNVNDDGSIPTQERNSWQTHNTYRVNAPLPEAFQSADVTVSLLRALDNGPGQPLSLSVRIGNGGAAASPEGVSVSFYEGDPAASGVLLGTVSAPSLAPDSFQDVVLNNVTALTGNADIYGVADPDDRVPECNETNNSVHIPAPNVLPDLIVSAIDAGAASTDPATLQLTGSVTATIKNQGTKEATGSIDILVFYDVNRNGLYDIGGDLVLGRATFDQAVAVGSSQTAEINVQGNMLFRDAPLKVFVDSAMRVEESDEGNNINTSAVSCKVVPDIGTFEPVLKWEWSGSPVLSQFDQVMSIPIVATIEDTNGDNVINLQDTPSVIFHSYAGGNYRSNGVLRALSGKDGRELWTVTDVAYRTNPEGSIAVADIDGDGIIEIIAPKNGGGIIVFEHTGAYKWQSAVPRAVFWGGASISDLDGDGTPEIVVGNTALNADGSLRWQGVGFAGNNGLGPLSVVADINLDGIPEVVAGAAAYSSDGQRLWQNSSVGDGFTAVGNFNEDPYPEIALVSSGRLFLLDYQGNVIWGPVSFPGGGRGGAPTIADMDGDGIPEIGVAGAGAYSVLKADGSVLWYSPTRDYSSNMTGSSAFDFDGDGNVEVVYADETFLRVYRGRDGFVIFETPNRSGTTYELPVIADIDNDGHADIVVCANQLIGGIYKGIRVFEDTNNSWANTRKIWNQHSYHITNINDDGSVPTVERNSWQALNTYRLNAQPGLTGSETPDLTASLLALIDNGSGQPLSASVRVGNGGTITSPNGVVLSLYQGDPASGGTFLGSTIVSALGAGEFRDVRIDGITGFHGTGGKGRMVVAHDVNTLSTSQARSAEQLFAVNVARWLIDDTSGTILAIQSNADISRNYHPAVISALETAGYSVTVTQSLNFSLEQLLTFDAVFVGRSFSSGAFFDNGILTDYLNRGGNVYLFGGVGNTAPEEAAGWENFLNTFGLAFDTTYNRIFVTPITSQHPIFNGITKLNSGVGSSIIDTDPLDPNGHILQFTDGFGVYAAFEEVTSSQSIFAVIDAANDVNECNETNNTASIAGDAQSSRRAVISVSTDKPVYGPDSPVTLQGVITNTGGLVGDFTAELRVEDTGGVTVFGATFPAHAITRLHSGAATIITDSWQSTGIVAGTYRLRGILRTLDGKAINEAVAHFTISNSEVGDPAVTLRTTTDRPVYHTHDTVQVQDLIQNVTTNTVVSNALLRVTVTGPAGQTVYQQERALNELAAGALRDQLDTAVLNGADIGDYQVLGQVIDSAGALLASDTAAFAVLADLNKQLLGTVVVQHAVLEAGQPQTCTHTVRNGGSIAAADLELHYAVVNIDTQQAVFDDSEVVTLPSDGENSADRTFSTRGLEGNYACVLQAKINTALATLAFAPFEVLPPPIEIDAEITTGNRGRLLVLLDSPKSADDKCRGVTQLDLSTDFAAALSPQATVTVSVQDKSGAVLDQENIDLASFSGPVNDNPGSDGVDLALTAFTDSGITMSLVPGADNDKAKLGTEYRFLAEVASDGTTITKESGPIHTSCSQPIAAGDQHGEFAISDLAVIAGTSAPKSDDPHGPKDAPDLVAQRAFLEELLTTAGWSATITDNAETFTGELRTGGYTVYALFNEQEKLSETVQKELREAVFRGEGLIVAGPHDSRNTKKQKLGHALGIKAHGHDSHAESVYIPAGVLTDAAGMIDLFAKDKVARIEPLTADSLATYEGTSAKGTATVDSVTVNDYGSGRGIFAGFDWLAAATRDSQGSLAAQALLKALAHAHPAATSPFAGSVAPLAMVLTNLGIATTAQATIDAPYNTRVIDAPQAEVTDTWIRWTFDLAEEQVLTLPFYLVLPETEGLVTIQGRVTAPVTDEGPGDLQAEPSLSIDVLPAQDGEDMNQAVDGLPAKLKKQVEKHLAKAFDYRDAKPEKALQEALKASDVLLDEGDQSEIALVRAKIAAWIRRLEMAIEQ